MVTEVLKLCIRLGAGRAMKRSSEELYVLSWALPFPPYFLGCLELSYYGKDTLSFTIKP